jgi:hypothetical protein
LRLGKCSAQYSPARGPSTQSSGVLGEHLSLVCDPARHSRGARQTQGAACSVQSNDSIGSASVSMVAGRPTTGSKGSKIMNKSNTLLRLCSLHCCLWLLGALLLAGSPAQAGQIPAVGDILVADQLGGTNNFGALVLVNPVTGERSILSDFGNPAQGASGEQFSLTGVALGEKWANICLYSILQRFWRRSHF